MPEIKEPRARKGKKMQDKPLAQAIAEMVSPEQRQAAVTAAISAELKKVEGDNTGTPTATLDTAQPPAAAPTPSPAPAPANAAAPTTAPAPAADTSAPANTPAPSPAPASVPAIQGSLLSQAQKEYEEVYGQGRGYGYWGHGAADDDGAFDGFPDAKADTAAKAGAIANSALNNAANFSGVIDRPVPEQLHDWIKEIFTTRRAHTSQGDLNFRKWLRQTLEAMGHKVQDMSGNLVVINSVKKKKSTVLFSCHIDTCHSFSESNGQRQALTYDAVMGHLFLAKPKDGPASAMPGCLGADDGAGIYIMLRMLKANVPGSYVFHIGEERGCIGSNAMVSNHADFLKKHTHAIAFDRPNDEEVIVTQSGQECASTAAGTALAALLHRASGGMVDLKVSHRGVVTDTKQYRYDIRECFNIGVGYSKQHSSSEVQDIAYLECLTEAACKVDWSTLPVVRNFPVDRYEGSYGSNYSGYGGRYSAQGSQHQRDVDLSKGAGTKQGGSNNKQTAKVTDIGVKKAKPTVAEGLELMLAMTKQDLVDWAAEDPDSMALFTAVLIAKYKGAKAEIENLQEFL